MTTKLRMIPSDSMCVKAFGYLNSQKKLVVNFRNGDSRYEFMDFPYTKFLSMCETDSLGKFFKEQISGKYSSEKVSE